MAATAFIDAEHPDVRAFAERAVARVRDRGVYTDLPLGTILEALATAYPGFSTDPTTADDPAFSA